MSSLTATQKANVVQCANTRLITDDSYDPDSEYPADWFISLFSFLNDEKLERHLGEEFYQTRFATAVMEALSLKSGKNKGFIKLQIVAYASICEAILNYTIEKFFIEEFGTRYAEHKLVQIKGALSTKTSLLYDNEEVCICKYKNDKANPSWASNPSKAEFAKEKGILSPEVADKYCQLYDLRNNAHLLKAIKADYFPKPKEAADAYKLVFAFIAEVKSFYEARTGD